MTPPNRQSQPRAGQSGDEVAILQVARQRHEVLRKAAARRRLPLGRAGLKSSTSARKPLRPMRHPLGFWKVTDTVARLPEIVRWGWTPTPRLQPACHPARLRQPSKRPPIACPRSGRPPLWRHGARGVMVCCTRWPTRAFLATESPHTSRCSRRRPRLASCHRARQTHNWPDCEARLANAEAPFRKARASVPPPSASGAAKRRQGVPARAILKHPRAKLNAPKALGAEGSIYTDTHHNNDVDPNHDERTRGAHNGERTRRRRRSAVHVDHSPPCARRPVEDPTHV